MADIIAQHNVGGGNLKKIYGTIRLCQTFQLTGDTAKSALYIRHRDADKVGALGDITIAIYEVDGADKPTGIALGTVTIASTNWSEILGTQNPMEDADVEFDDCILQPVTTYALVISATNGDSSNYIRWYSNTGDYSDGEAFVSADNGDSWAPITGEDFGFLVFGDSLVPGAPTIVSPTPTGVTNITLDETPLEWAAGDPAGDTYEIYFRESGDDWELVGEAQAGVEWTIDFGTLNYGTTYEWRIDATNVYGTTTGDTWSFDTLVFSWVLVSYRLLPGGGGAGYGPYDSPPGTQGTDWEWTGESNMLTVKRLVAVANSKVWYESI